MADVIDLNWRKEIADDLAHAPDLLKRLSDRSLPDVSPDGALLHEAYAYLAAFVEHVKRLQKAGG